MKPLVRLLSIQPKHSLTFGLPVYGSSKARRNFRRKGAVAKHKSTTSSAAAHLKVVPIAAQYSQPSWSNCQSFTSRGMSQASTSCCNEQPFDRRTLLRNYLNDESLPHSLCHFLFCPTPAGLLAHLAQYPLRTKTPTSGASL